MVVALACGDAPRTPTSPTGTSQTQIRVQGRVAIPSPGTPAGLAGVEVQVVEGPATGTRTITDSSGRYSLQLPAAPFRLQWSRAGFEPRESTLHLAEPGGVLELPDVFMRRIETGPEWTVTGVVRDGRGNPVADADVRIVGFVLVLTGKTDAAGRFTITSNQTGAPQPELQVEKWPGYPTTRMVFKCCTSGAPIFVDVRLLRVVGITLIDPAVVRVGQHLRIVIRADYDDGSQQVILPTQGEGSSSNRSVVRFGSDQIFIFGLSPGAATIHFTYWGVGPSSLQVRVDP